MLTKEETIALWTREGPWGEHFDYPYSDWKHEVANEYTTLGYWDWVYSKWTADQDVSVLPEVTDEAVRRAQTVAAITELYNKEIPGIAEEIYGNWGESIGGFPGVWMYLARFSLELDSALVAEWESGAREFLEDVFDANKFLCSHLREWGFEDEPGEIVLRFIAGNPKEPRGKKYDHPG